MGKGSHRRPPSKEYKTDPYQDNWDRIFKKQAEDWARAYEQRQEESDRQIEEALLRHAEEIFSERGIDSLKEVSRATGDSGQIEDASPPGQSPHIEGS